MVREDARTQWLARAVLAALGSSLPYPSVRPPRREAVVAVFTNGKAWQFQEWQHSKPVDLFHRCQYDGLRCLPELFLVLD